MIKIPFSLRDFQELLEDNSNMEEKKIHAVLYFDNGPEIFFYKVIGYVLYYVGLIKESTPETIDIDMLIRNDFNAIQIFKPLHIVKYETIG